MDTLMARNQILEKLERLDIKWGDKFDHQEEIFHKIDKKLAVAVQRLESITGSVGRHEEVLGKHEGKIDKLQNEQSMSKGKQMGLTGSISAGVGILVALVSKIFGGN